MTRAYIIYVKAFSLFHDSDHRSSNILGKIQFLEKYLKITFTKTKSRVCFPSPKIMMFLSEIIASVYGET
jgi:hypothetical protein